ncbi:MAG: hypothetical protein PVH41_16085, partial [Anaerolineae bacterium]
MLLTILFGILQATPPTRAVNIAPRVWNDTAEGRHTDVLVILKEQADLTHAVELQAREERLRTIYDALRTTARRSQAALRAKLDRAGVEYRPFYIVNMIALRSDRDLVTHLAEQPEVARIVPNPRVRLDLPEPESAARSSQAAAGVEW